MKTIAYLCVVTFTLHLVWENAQAPLYQGFESFTQHFFICFLGTIGDVFFTLGVFAVIALLKRNIHWVTSIQKTDLTALAIIGFFLALGIEWRALLFDRWAYADAMPLIPYFEVGISPVLQMTILLPLSIYLTSKIIRRTA